jgi:hypothetical protein
MIMFLSHSGASRAVYDRCQGIGNMFYCAQDRELSTVDSWRPHLDKVDLVVADHPNFSYKKAVLTDVRVKLIGLSPELPEIFEYQGQEMFRQHIPMIPSDDEDNLVWGLFYGDSWLTKPRDVNGKATREAKKAADLLEPIICHEQMKEYTGPFGIWYKKIWGKRYVTHLDTNLAFPAYAKFLSERKESSEHTLDKLIRGALIE